jgi:hypothetical protein
MRHSSTKTRHISTKIGDISTKLTIMAIIPSKDAEFQQMAGRVMKILILGTAQ